MRRTTLFLLLATHSLRAGAAEWRDFEHAFPVFPCTNGWASCTEGGERVSPELREGADGLLLSSDLRLDWSKLSPTVGFSPFEDPADIPRGHLVSPARPVVATAVTRAPRPTATKRVQPPIDPGTGAASDAGGGPTKAVEAPGPPDQVVKVVPQVVSIDCAADPELASIAREHGLDEAQRTCLSEALAASDNPQQRDRISRVLITDAQKRRDSARLGELLQHHVEHIDASDPDLDLRYVLHLRATRPGATAEIERWSSEALAHKTRWTGSEYTRNVEKLYSLRAATAYRSWQTALGTPDEATARASTLTEAQSWLGFARESGRDSAKALQLCQAAASSPDDCR